MTTKAGGGSPGRRWGGKILNIRLSRDTGAHIPVKINNVHCLVLIDTGASRVA